MINLTKEIRLIHKSLGLNMWDITDEDVYDKVWRRVYRFNVVRVLENIVIQTESQIMEDTK